MLRTLHGSGSRSIQELNFLQGEYLLTEEGKKARKTRDIGLKH